MWINPETKALAVEPTDGCELVHGVPTPLTGRLEKAVLDGAELVDGQWQQKWKVMPLTADEIAQVEAAELANLSAALIGGAQQRLDDFARTRHYDSILSACTYATSTNPQFAAEGQRCVELRDATWAVVYAVLDAVQRGERVVTGFDDIAGELPGTEW